MNKIYTPFISTLVMPLRAVFKTSKKIMGNLKLDTFVGGLLIGAIFSLIVNVITIRITDDITKQRALEALQNEIAYNNIQANGTLGYDKKNIADKSLPNVFYYYPLYDDNVWSNSLTLQYLEQANPQQQVLVNIYYDYVIRDNNSMLTNLNSLSKTYMQECFNTTKPLTLTQTKSCKANNALFLSLEAKSAILVLQYGYKTLDAFHPTQDRLNNPFLKLLMGSDAIGYFKPAVKK